MTDRIELSDAEKCSAAWGKVQAYLEKRLTELRIANDRDMTEQETAKQRGRIAEVRAMLALADDRPNL